MKKQSFNFLIMIAPVLLAALCLISVYVKDNQATMPIPLALTFTGEYTRNGEEWSPYTKDCSMSALEGDVWLKGHFDAEIEDGGRLSFLCDHIGVSVFVNGELMYMDMPTESRQFGMPLTPSACGRRWEQIVCPEIGTTDEIEIHFMNPHKAGNPHAYQDAMNTCCMTPDNNIVLKEYLKPYIYPFNIIGYGLLVLSVMLLGVALSAALLKIPGMKRLFYFGMTALFAGCFMIFDSMVLFLTEESLVVQTYGRQLSLMLVLYFAGLIVAGSLTQIRHRIGRVSVWIGGMIDAGIIGAAMTGRVLIYDTQSLWLTVQIIRGLIFIVLCIQEWLIQKRDMKQPAHILFFAAILLDAAGVGYHVYYDAICSKTVFLLVFMLYMFMGVKYVMLGHFAAVRNKQLQEELENSRITLMLSQIQPHFLYNVLGTIRGLCRIDGEQAWRALGDFSSYLRGNMSALSDKGEIHFSAELAHIEAYLRLEKMRMGEELEIVYDIKETDFFLPSLTIQPLVENGVKHGIFEKPGGGTLTLRSDKNNGKITIEVLDDGVGFDVTAPPVKKDNHAHVGLMNVKKRLEKMSGGQLFIESVPGRGTKVLVILPDKKE